MPDADRARFFEVSLDLFCIADFEGRFLEVNPAFTSVLGWTRDELLERPFLEFVHPEDCARTVAELGRLASGSRTLHFENRYRCEDGSWRWLSWRAVPDADRGVIFAVARDETELRAVRDSLRQSEAQHRVTLRAIGDGVLATDAQGRITMLNPVAETLTGWTESEARGRACADVFHIVHEDSRELAPSPVDEVLETGLVHALANHTALIARDGVERSIADSAAPILDGCGGIAGVVLVFRDVTEERERRRAAAVSAERYRLSLQASELGTFDWDMVTGTFVVDEGFERLLGRTLDRVDDLEQTAAEFVSPQDVPVLLGLLEQVQRGLSTGLDVELRVLTAAGEPHWVRVLSRVHSDTDGRPVRMLGTLGSIDGRKGMEADLRSQLDLQTAVAETSTDLLRSVGAGSYAAIDRALVRLATQVGAMRAFVFERSGDRVSNTHEWCADGAEPQREGLQDLPIGRFGWLLGSLGGGQVVAVADREALAGVAGAEREAMGDVGDRSLIVAPLMDGAEVAGCVGLADSEPRAWTRSELALVGLVGDEISGALQRARAHEALAELNRTLERQVEERTAALREAEQAGGVGSFEFDVGSGLLRWSDELCRIYGRDPKTFAPSYEGFIEHLHPEDRAAVARETEAAVSRGGRYGHTKRIVRTDGEIRLIETRAEVVAGPTGRPARVVGVCLDITDRVRAEEARRESDRLNRATLDALPARIAVLDERGVILGTNQAWRRFAEENQGTPAAVGPGGNYLATCEGAGSGDGGQPREMASAIRDVVGGVRPHASMEYLCHCSPGRRWFVARVTRFRGDGPTRVVVAHEEVTEQKLAEQRIQQSEHRFHALFEFAPDAIVMAGPDGSITRINRQAELLFGYPRQELEGQPVEVLVPQALRGHHASLRQGFIEAPSARAMGGGRGPLEGVRKDGTVFPIDISLGPMDSPEGVLVAAAVRDVSDRVRADAELRGALKEKETLLKEIHHRVKNNLQIISSLLSMQSDSSADAGARELLRESIHRVRSMALIHERLYQSESLARIDFGDYARSLATFLFRSYRLGSAVQLTVEAETTELSVETAVPLGLVLNELVTNALKHALAAGGAGELRVSVRPEPDGRFSLTVADTGPGLPADFDLDAATTMGMTLVRALANQLKADLTVESGEGARFRVEFEELSYAVR